MSSDQPQAGPIPTRPQAAALLALLDGIDVRLDAPDMVQLVGVYALLALVDEVHALGELVRRRGWP